MDIKRRYAKEIDSIHNIISKLEQGKIYELESNRGVRGYPSYTTIAADIREQFDNLLDMIEENKDSTLDVVKKFYDVKNSDYK